MSYSFIRGIDCQSCFGDFDGSCVSPCTGECVECKRTAAGCVCHCKGWNIRTTDDELTLDLTCSCPTSPGGQSIPITTVIVGVRFTADSVDFGNFNNDQIAAITSPGDTTITWSFFRSLGSTNLICPYTSDDWAPFQIDYAGNTSIVSTGFPTFPDDYLDMALAPAILSGSVYNCSADRLPEAFLIKVSDALNNQLYICPVRFPFTDTINCPSCPNIELESAVASGCPDAGEIDLHFKILGVCLGGSGFVTLEIGSHTDSIDFSESEAFITFSDVPCDEAFPIATVRISYDVAGGSECSDCIGPVTLCISIPMDGSPYSLC